MTLFSLVFWGFVAGSLVVYYLVPGRWQWVVLLAASVAFYAAGGLSTVLYLLFTILTTYGAARLAAPARRGGQEKAASSGRRRLFVALALVVNFGALFIFKYGESVLGALARLLPPGTVPGFALLMPLGLSFYTFQAMGYLIDVYRGKYEPEKNVLRLALFVSFFPQLIQGPIGRYAALAPQLTASRRFSFTDGRAGITRILWGLLKKLVVADRLAVVATYIFDNYADKGYGGFVIFAGVFLYSIQLYCDFSGGIDIVSGVARLFGVTLANNFRRPFFAVSLTDFWRRWHISLGAWMKDYLFYPLSLSKPFIRLGKAARRRIGGRLGKILPASLATFIVYFVIGIWHGGSFKYIAFGLWNGMLITASLLLEPFFFRCKRALGVDGGAKWFAGFQIFRTLLLVTAGRYLTRAARLLTALDMLRVTITHPIPSQIFQKSVFPNMGLMPVDFVVAGAGILLVFAAEVLQERGKVLSRLTDRLPAPVQWLCMALFIFALLVFGVFRGDYIAAEFIYKQF